MQERFNPLDPEILKIKADALPLKGNDLVRTYEILRKDGNVPSVIAFKVASEFHPLKNPKSKK